MFPIFHFQVPISPSLIEVIISASLKFINNMSYKTGLNSIMSYHSLKELFLHNGYPPSFIENIFKRFRISYFQVELIF